MTAALAALSGAARSPAAQTWVFDVDGCLLDGMSASSLRPGALELLDELARRGVRLLVWSAGGAQYARVPPAQAQAHAAAARALWDKVFASATGR